MTDTPGSPPALDVAILGAGPAGASAAFHLARHHAQIALFDPAPPGGLTRAARRIDNLPGHPGGIPGRAYARLLARGIEEGGIPLRAVRIDAVRREAGGAFALVAGGEVVATARAVIVASGTAPVPAEGNFPAAVDAALLARDAAGFPEAFAGERVLVVGGGEAAVDTALSAADRGAAVTLACRGATPRANARLLTDFANAGIPVRAGVTLAALAGRPGRLAARLSDGESLDCRAVVACIGRLPSLPELPPAGERDGIFLAGDATGRAERYIAPALADGTFAAAFALRRLGIR